MHANIYIYIHAMVELFYSPFTKYKEIHQTLPLPNDGGSVMSFSQAKDKSIDSLRQVPTSTDPRASIRCLLSSRCCAEEAFWY